MSEGAAQFETRGGLEVLVFPALATSGVDAVVTTRAGGVSVGPYDSLNLGLHVGDDPAAVVENRRRAAASIGASLEDLVFAEQVHGRSATIVDATERGRGSTTSDDAVPATDVLVTRDADVVLACLVADCVPIVLVDPDVGVVATAHAGWRGTVARAAAAAVEAMVRLGAQTERLVACIGPAVAPRRYEVGAEVAQAARVVFGHDSAILVPAGETDGPPRWTFDLPAANRQVLLDAGLPPWSVHVAPHTTGPAGGATERFFSDRAVRPCGRFALLVRRHP